MTLHVPKFIDDQVLTEHQLYLLAAIPVDVLSLAFSASYIRGLFRPEWLDDDKKSNQIVFETGELALEGIAVATGSGVPIFLDRLREIHVAGDVLFARAFVVGNSQDHGTHDSGYRIEWHWPDTAQSLALLKTCLAGAAPDSRQRNVWLLRSEQAPRNEAGWIVLAVRVGSTFRLLPPPTTCHAEPYVRTAFLRMSKVLQAVLDLMMRQLDDGFRLRTAWLEIQLECVVLLPLTARCDQTLCEVRRLLAAVHGVCVRWPPDPALEIRSSSATGSKTERFSEILEPLSRLISIEPDTSLQWEQLFEAVSALFAEGSELWEMLRPVGHPQPSEAREVTRRHSDWTFTLQGPGPCRIERK